jgi:hypothetical protein
MNMKTGNAIRIAIAGAQLEAALEAISAARSQAYGALAEIREASDAAAVDVGTLEILQNLAGLMAAVEGLTKALDEGTSLDLRRAARPVRSLWRAAVGA